LVVNYRTEDFSHKVRDWCKDGVDVILDIVGKEYSERNVEILARRGRLVCIATMSGADCGINMRVLMQKPFGRDLAEATRLVESVRARHLVAAVNFQLRHAPCVRAVRSLVRDGAIGDALDAEIRVVCRMPWETWPFLEGLPRILGRLQEWRATHGDDFRPAALLERLGGAERLTAAERHDTAACARTLGGSPHLPATARSRSR
jgi:hypothetical protein